MKFRCRKAEVGLFHVDELCVVVVFFILVVA